MRTASGRDFQALVMGGAFASAPTGTPGTTNYAPASFMAVTANNAALNDTDTALAGEIATAGGGLIRKATTPARTAGASSWTHTATFTANGSDVVPVTLAKMAMFNQLAVGGTMVFESMLPSTAPIQQSGDQVTITETVTQ